MATFQPNPNVEASQEFELVKPGTYQMRVKAISEERDSKTTIGNKVVTATLEFIDPSACTKLDGTVATNPGNVFDNGLVTFPAEKQGKLRGFVEACGKSWSEISDTDDLVGCEVLVSVGLEEYKGKQKNTVNRYVKG